MNTLPVTHREEILVKRYVASQHARGHFTVANAYLLSGTLDVSVLEQAVNDVMAAHDNLRSRFVFDGDKVSRVLAPEVRIVIDRQTSGEAAPDRATAVAAATETMRLWLEHAPGATEFPLIRVRVISLEASYHVLYYDVHHLVFDVWSHAVFITALFEAYAKRSAGIPYVPARKPATIGEYLEYMRDDKTREQRRRHLAFWNEHLAGYRAAPKYMNGRAREPQLTWSTGAAIACALYDFKDNDIARLARALKVSPYAVHMAAYALLIFAKTSLDDVVIETAVSLRIEPRHVSFIGSAFGSMPFRCRCDEHETLADFIRRVHQEYAEATVRRDAAWEEWNSPIMQPSGLLSSFSSFFLNYWPRPIATMRIPGLEARPTYVPAPANTAVRCEYNVSIMETDEGAHYRLRYHDNAYTREEAVRYLRLLAVITLHIATRPDATLGQLAAEIDDDVVSHYARQGRILSEEEITSYVQKGMRPPAHLLRRTSSGA